MVAMYYRKYFAGSVDDASLTRNVVNISNNSVSTEYYVQDDVVCRAVKETLEDMGITCTYTSENSTLSIDGLTMQIIRVSNTIYYNANGIVFGDSTSLPFSGNYYKFYVTLKGDIDSVLMVSIGYYSNPYYDLYGFCIGKGKDLKDGSPIRVVSKIADSVSNSSFFYIIKNDEIFADYKNKVQFGQAITNIQALNGKGTEVTLVECVAQPGRFKMDNCYFGNAVLSNGEFYNIGGDIYYKPSINYIIKCVNDQL